MRLFASLPTIRVRGVAAVLGGSGTWNMGEVTPPAPDVLAAWLPRPEDAMDCGVVALAVQECMYLEQMQKALQIAVGRW